MSTEKEKLNADEVPGRFTEWLLEMGCPVEKVPNLDSAKQMCRGQYYIVWRSLMGEVKSKDLIRHKRLTVFSDDLSKINDKNEYNKYKKDLIEPNELTLWREETDLKEKVVNAESQIKHGKEDLDHLIDKVSSKLSSRNISRQNTHDIERRVFLLQRITENLEAKKADLKETIKIANLLSYTEKNIEIENKLDKCLSGSRRQSSRLTTTSQSILYTGNQSIASSSITSTNSEIDYENNIASLVKCRGDALWPQLYERRAELCVALSQACAQQSATNTDKITPKSALAQTAALHCLIALEAIKNRAHIRKTQKMLAESIAGLNDYLSGDACEYLVLNCERTGAQSRVNTLKGILEEIESRGGFFECDSRYTGDKNWARQQISTVNNAIISKKEELKKLIQSLAVTERKIINIKQCLETVFGCFKNGGALMNDITRFKDIMSLPQDSIGTIQQFYKENHIKEKKIDISLDLDLSLNNSSFNNTENPNPRFVDELRMYLQTFSLERNRKLVLDNGAKIWVYETLQSSLQRILASWQTDELPCSLLCPSVTLAKNLLMLTNDIQRRDELEAITQILDCSAKENYITIDITSKTTEENEMVDKIKKRLNKNLLSLEKVNRTLDLGAENIEFWNSNAMKQYISSNRTIDGKTYKDYEALYIYSLKL